ncbi:MAG: hypothetical protein B6D63_04780 [Candidatus Latescibacteria bacterium 4484_7]|nr:MAG: hypothetical protein B6D63_04780 [Candidatus Latescibacteria bacterium 4484_7]
MGKLFALLSALTWAVAVILFKKSGERVPPFALNLFKAGVSVLLFIGTLFLMGQGVWGEAPLKDYLILFLSGVIGIAISDTLFLMSLNIVGAGILAIVDTLYSPLVVLLAYLFIGERFGFWQILGMVFVVLGVLATARPEATKELSRARLIEGISIGALAMITLAVGIVIAKPVLNRSPVVWATTVREIGCLVVMVPIAFASKDRWRILSAFKPSRTWRFSLTGTIIGSYLALMLWIAGMKYTLAGTAAILNQSNTIFVLIFASVFLKEGFTKRKFLAAALAITGIMMVTLG